jgi:hypothetical protein
MLKNLQFRLHGSLVCVSVYKTLLATAWMIGIRFPAGVGDFSFHHSGQKGPGAHAASYPMDTRALSLWVKRPGREADHSPSRSEVKEWVELYLHSPIRLRGVVLS